MKMVNKGVVMMWSEGCGKADIDPYYAIETENELILKYFDYELKGIGEFTPKETY